MNIVTTLFYLVVIGLPAYFINKWIMGIMQPRRSWIRFLLYLIVILATAFVCTALFCWFMFRKEDFPY